MIELFCDESDLTWEHVNNTASRALTSITNGPENAVTRNIANSLQADTAFRDCLCKYCSNDQVITICLGLIFKGRWFTLVHTEIGGGVSFALLHEGIKFWCAFTSSTGTRFVERCCYSTDGFIDLMQRGPVNMNRVF